jgi:hypothetical protein
MSVDDLLSLDNVVDNAAASASNDAPIDSDSMSVSSSDTVIEAGSSN